MQNLTDPVKLLLVDDLEENLLALEAVLRRDGVQLLKSTSGSQALELLLQHDIALSIIDVQMPEMDGFELAEYMRGTERTRRVPIIFLTAGAHDEYRQFRGYESGAVDFMFKPFDPNILYSKTEVFLELFRQRQEIARHRDVILEREERLSLALRAGHTGVWDWNFQTGEVIWSEETYAIFGCSHRQFEGTLPSFLNRIHPEDRDRVLSEQEKAAGQPGSFSLEYRIVRPDGRMRQITNLGILRHDALGKPTSIVGAVTDVTQERQAEAALKQREVELQTLSDNSPCIITRFDRKLRHVYVNRTIETITRRPVSEFIGRTNREIGMPEDLCVQWETSLNQVFATLEPQVLEFTFETLDGPKRFSTHCVPERNSEGVVDCLLCVTRDITKEWEASEALSNAKLLAEAANAAKDQFLAVLSHELRTPLSPIRLVISNWEMENDIPEGMKEGLDIIRRNIDLECRLIDDLLDVNRIAKGKVELRVSQLNLHEQISHALQIVDLDANGRQIKLKQELHAEHAEINGDAARIQQILWNLLSNAIKFTPSEGTVTIRTYHQDANTIHVEISDTGIGISADKIDSIFNAFEQGGIQVTRQFGGLGLGLAISQTLASLHNGSLSVESMGLGKGATFRLVLPLTDRLTNGLSPSQNGLDDKQQHPTGLQKSLQILLVEDHQVSARLLEKLLSSVGHHVHTAFNVQSAVKSWKSQSFDLLISDLGLPDGTGYELLVQLQSLGDVRAIALTGFGMQDEVARSLEAGFVAHVTKPVQFSDFIQIINQIASNIGI